MIVVPYLIAAPLLFAETPGARITLGTLVQTSNSFGRVFSSLSVISENMGMINEWRSTLVRLRQFEARLYGRHADPAGKGDVVELRALVREPVGTAELR